MSWSNSGARLGSTVSPLENFDTSQTSIRVSGHDLVGGVELNALRGNRQLEGGRLPSCLRSVLRGVSQLGERFEIDYCLVNLGRDQPPLRT